MKLLVHSADGKQTALLKTISKWAGFYRAIVITVIQWLTTSTSKQTKSQAAKGKVHNNLGSTISGIKCLFIQAFVLGAELVAFFVCFHKK